MVCENCKYYDVCGDEERTEPCKGYEKTNEPEHTENE